MIREYRFESMVGTGQPFVPRSMVGTGQPFVPREYSTKLWTIHYAWDGTMGRDTPLLGARVSRPVPGSREPHAGQMGRDSLSHSLSHLSHGGTGQFVP